MSDGTYNARGDTHLRMDGVSSWPIADSIEVAIAKTSVIRQLRGAPASLRIDALVKGRAESSNRGAEGAKFAKPRDS